MNEHEQAEALARWLDEGARGDPPPGIDPEVLDGLYAVRPDLAPPARVRVDDILASVHEGPLSAEDDAADNVVAFPVSPMRPATDDPDDDAPDRTARPWGPAAGVLIAMAAAFLVVLMPGREAPTSTLDAPDLSAVPGHLPDREAEAVAPRPVPEASTPPASAEGMPAGERPLSPSEAPAAEAKAEKARGIADAAAALEALGSIEAQTPRDDDGASARGGAGLGAAGAGYGGGAVGRATVSSYGAAARSPTPDPEAEPVDEIAPPAPPPAAASQATPEASSSDDAPVGGLIGTPTRQTTAAAPPAVALPDQDAELAEEDAMEEEPEVTAITAGSVRAVMAGSVRAAPSPQAEGRAASRTRAAKRASLADAEAPAAQPSQPTGSAVDEALAAATRRATSDPVGAARSLRAWIADPPADGQRVALAAARHAIDGAAPDLARTLAQEGIALDPSSPTATALRTLIASLPTP